MNPKLSNITHKWVEVLRPFSENYFSKLSASKISELSKFPQQSASRILNQLIKLNLIKFKTEGKNKLFYFDFNIENSKSLLKIIEIHKSIDFNLNYTEVGIIFNKILKYCSGIILFGSYAKGKNKKNSDLDLIILDSKNKEKIKEIIEISPFKINAHFFSSKKFCFLFESGDILVKEIFRGHVFFGDVFSTFNCFIGGKRWLV